MGRGQLKYSRRARGRGRGGRGGRGEAAESDEDASTAPDTDHRARAVRGLPSNADRFVERDDSGATEYEYRASIGTRAAPKEHYETALEQDEHDGLASLSIVSFEGLLATCARCVVSLVCAWAVWLTITCCSFVPAVL
jgi:hypothetical protein